MDLLQNTASDTVRLLEKKEISAREVLDFYLDRVEKHNPALNAFCTMNPGARQQAERIDELRAQGKTVGKLAGLPVGFKDNLCTKGLRTTAGSKMLADFHPPYSATVVERIQNEGGILLGKTNMDEFAMGSSNESSYFGPALNPWSMEHVPGGSSGGSAAAVAGGLCPISLGTDTGGSIRQPAHFCGIVGFKPTYGRVSRYGMIAFASSLDQAGPMALSVEDAALLLECMAGGDEYDSTCTHEPVPAFSRELKVDLKGKRVGLPVEYFDRELSEGVRAVLDQTIEALKKEGAELVEVSLPRSEHAVSVYYMVATSEASSNLSRFDGVRFGHRADFTEKPPEDLVDFYSRNRSEAFGMEVKRRIMLGTFALSSGYYDAYYHKACLVRRAIADDFKECFKKCDLILSPVATTPAFKLGEKGSDPLKMYMNDIFTTATNLAGLPGMSLPGGFSKEGLPVGVQLTGPAFSEQMLLNFALGLEKILPVQGGVAHGLR